MATASISNITFQRALAKTKPRTECTNSLPTETLPVSEQW